MVFSRYTEMSEQSQSSLMPLKSSAKRPIWLPLLLFLAGVLLLLAGLFYARYSQSLAEPDAVVLPQRVAGQRRTDASYGLAAIAEVSRLHGQEFPLSSGAAGRYGQPGSSVTLWVTGAPNQLLAGRLVTEMEEAIAQGESPFAPTGKRLVNGRSVYQLTGMGQAHFYFRSANLVIWLAADAAVAEQALEEMLSFYP